MQSDSRGLREMSLGTMAGDEGYSRGYEEEDEEEDEEEEATWNLIPAQVQEGVGTCWDRVATHLKLKDNEPFRTNVELSLRATFFMCLMVRPFIKDGAGLGIFGFLKSRDILTPFVIVYAVYNMAPTLGEVVKATVSSLKGVALVILNIWFLRATVDATYTVHNHYLKSLANTTTTASGFLGTAVTETSTTYSTTTMTRIIIGVTQDSPAWVWWFTLIEGGIFIFLLLFLNFDMGFKTFGINMFAGYWMDFLDPNSKHRISYPWEDGFPFTDDGTLQFLRYIVGTIVLILALSIPWPLTARKKYLDRADQICVAMPGLLKRFSGYLESKRKVDQDAAHHEMKEFDAARGKLKDAVNAAYWETLGLIWWLEGSRKCVVKLDETVGKCYDHIYSIWSSSHSEHKIHAQHGNLHLLSSLSSKFFKFVQGPLDKCIDEVKEITQQVQSASTDGVIDDGERARLKSTIDKVKEAQDDLTRAVYRAREELTREIPDVVGKNTRCLEAFSGSLVMCLNVSAICTKVSDFADQVVKMQDDKQEMEKAVKDVLPSQSFFLSVFDWSKLKDQDNISFALRSSLSIFLAFALGLFGTRGVFKPYTADIAQTAAVLLITYTGSALLKSSNRAQGVMLGQVFGLIIKAFLYGCEWYFEASLYTSFAIWSGVGIFVRFHFPTASDVAKFMTAFGDQQILKSGDPPPLPPGTPPLRVCELGPPSVASSFLKIETTLMAIGILILVDLAFAHKKASKTAADKFTAAVTHLNKAITHCIEGTKVKGEDADALLADVQSMTTDGQEAYQEPRWWRTPWPNTVWDTALKRLSQLRYSVAALERVLESDKLGKIHPLLNAEKDLQDRLQASLKRTEDFSEFFKADTKGTFKPEDKVKEDFVHHDKEEQKALATLRSKIANAAGWIPSNSAQLVPLVEDPLSIGAGVLSALDSTFYSLGQLQHAILFQS